jgi:hypothetical protein
MIFFSSFSSSISTTSTQNLFNDEKLELFVSQKFETSLFMTIFSSRNFISSSRTISYFFEFRKTDDHSNDSEAEKTKANKFFVNELMKTQTKEQEIKTTSFSISDSFFLIKKNDTDDRFSFAKFFKVEETTKDATNSNTESHERIKVESQIRNSNERSRTQKFQQRSRRHRRISFSSFFHIQILKLFLNLLLLTSKQKQRTRQNK